MQIGILEVIHITVIIFTFNDWINFILARPNAWESGCNKFQQKNN